MRIGLVTGEFPPMEGGVGAFTEQLGRALKALGHEVHIITSIKARPATAPRKLAGIREPIDINGVELKVGASIGISRYPQDGQTVSELLATADNAMYTVKARGHGGFRFSSKVAD